MKTKYGYRRVSLLTRQTLALILAGGRGSRLKHLTQWRAKPATPFGGKFRIIDFALSNCINSGIRQISVITQYKAHSLILHIQKGWGFLRGEFGEYVELLPAQQRVQASWYQGTADAVFQNLDIIRAHDPEFVLVLGGDHIYKMDYGAMIAAHEANNADITLGCVEVTPDDAKSLGVVSVDHRGRIVKFAEKPTHPETVPGRPDAVLASMGIYVFNKRFLYEQIVKDADDPDSSHDFGKDIIPSVIGKHRAYAHRFVDVQTSRQNYWRDVGTVDAYWEANMDLISVSPELNIYDETWPIWTYQEQLPPAKFIFDDDDRRGTAVDSMVSGGCIISGAKIKRSLLFSKVAVNSYTELTDTLVLPNVAIGRNCRFHKTILDEDCVIPDGTVIGEDPAADAERFYVTEGGVVLVTPQMLGQDVYKVR